MARKKVSKKAVETPANTTLDDPKKKPQELMIDIPCDLKQIKHVRKLLNDFCSELGFSKEEMVNLEIALNEGLSNAIDHGSANNKKKHVEVQFKIVQRFLVILIRDFGGIEFNPEYYDRITLKKDWGHGGRGIYLMKTIMDEVSYIFCPEHFTTLYLSKKLTR